MRRLLQKLAMYVFHACVVRPVLHLIVGVHFRRRGGIPDGPCLVVANHNSHLDAAVLMTLFPLRRLPDVHPVAAADYFGETWLKRTMAMALMNAVPIERRPARGQDPLAPIVERLRAGESLVFFPEGSRGEAGVVAPFRPGVGALVRMLPGLLVVPVFLSGPERIWPRGRLLPVPLSIDVHVGRPRSYPHDEDSRRIAESVREDVLALAPPPPPVPGPPPEPPLRVAICGIDPRLRRAAYREVAERLGRAGPTRGVGTPPLAADAHGAREASGPVPAARGRGWLGLLAPLFRVRAPFDGAGFLELVDRARVAEALERDRETRFVVEEDAPLIELLARAALESRSATGEAADLSRVLQYLTGQRRLPLGAWWRFLRRAPETWLLAVLDLARPPVPDLLVLLHSPAAAVMTRLRSEGRALARGENEPDLEELQAAYAEVAATLRRRRRVELLELDGSLPPEAVAEQVEAACRRVATGPRELAPRA